MSRFVRFQKIVEGAAANIALSELPPIANELRLRCGADLPLSYWKLALATKAHIHENVPMGVAGVTTALGLLENYGKSALDWAVRRHAVEIKRTADAKRIADVSDWPIDAEGALAWQLERFLLLGKGAKNDVAPVKSAFARICGATAIVFGPDSLISLCRELLDTAYARASVASIDFKTTLQEEAQPRFHARPTYSVCGATGPDHAPVFNSVGCWRST